MSLYADTTTGHMDMDEAVMLEGHTGSTLFVKLATATGCEGTLTRRYILLAPTSYARDRARKTAVACPRPHPLMANPAKMKDFGMTPILM